MAERWTATQAGAHCDGVKAGTYRDYVSRQGAPGPLRERDPDTGAKLYDADAVREWHANRPGRGRARSRLVCTESVPETITDGSAAGRGTEHEERT